MGDPKFSRRRYQTPSHPWQKERIDSENELIKKYGLKNKRELWKVQSLLRRFRQRSRILQAQIRYGNKQAEKERDQLLGRLERLCGHRRLSSSGENPSPIFSSAISNIACSA